MRIVIASGAFKDVYSPIEACRIIQEALLKLSREKSLDLHAKILPMADGGEYSADVLLDQLPCEKIMVPHVVDPRGIPKEVFYVKLDDTTAYIASSVILGLGPDKTFFKNPLKLTSFGLGEMIKHAIDNSFKKIIIGLGGTNTVDAGIGMAQALGMTFLDSENRRLYPTEGKYFTGGDLFSVRGVVSDGLLEQYKGLNVDVVCDADINVTQMDISTNQKIGPHFDGQKEEILKILNSSLRTYSALLDRTVIQKKTRQKFSLEPLERQPFFGAAGGVGLSLFALFDITVSSGSEFFFRTLNMAGHVQSADLVITGEGKLDNSLHGKTPIGVSRFAKTWDKPVVLLCGTVDDALKKYFHSFVSEDLPPALKRAGIYRILSCHGVYDKMQRPESYEGQVGFYKKHNPEVFFRAFKEYFDTTERFVL